MDNKCLCNCRCAKIYQVLKVYDHLGAAKKNINSLELNIENMKNNKNSDWSADNALFNAYAAWSHLQKIHDKYAKDLGMDE